LLIDALMLLWSAWILRAIRVHERREPRADAHFWRDLRDGLRFVAGTRLLVALAAVVGCWQMFQRSATRGWTQSLCFATEIGSGSGRSWACTERRPPDCRRRPIAMPAADSRRQFPEFVPAAPDCCSPFRAAQRC
jgi:hypothetical protein